MEPVVARKTIAESIQVGNPASLGWRALTALRESGGMAVAASDAEIIEAQALTATLAGIFAEPAAATSVAVAKKLLSVLVVESSLLRGCYLHRLMLSQLQSLQPRRHGLKVGVLRF